ncbi:MAG: O-antigen ligase family protein [Gemmatimonadetes bacterium]|nr:O-antigen ligase family protein [Gemmatimonadota bacterium]
MPVARGRAVPIPGGRASGPVRTRPDLLLISVGLLTLTSIWRVHALFPILGSLQVPSLSAVGAYVLFFTTASARKRFRELSHPIGRWALFLLFMAGVSAFGGILTTRTVFFITGDFSKTLLMMGLIVVSVRSMRDLEWLFGAQVLGAALYAGTILTRYSVDSTGRLGDLIYYDSNDLAMLLVMALPVAAYFLRGGVVASRRLIALFAFVLIVVGMVKTGSRGGFLGFITVLLFLLFRFTALSRKARMGSVVALLAGFLLVANDQYWTMMSTLLNPKADYNFSGQSEGGRMEIWKRGFGYMAMYPLTGVGAANFGAAEATLSSRARERALRGQGTQSLAPHNSFVMAAAELGVPGFVAFIAILVVGIQSTIRIVKSRRRGPVTAEVAAAQSLLGAMLGFVVTGFFLSQTYSSFLYTLLGMIIALTTLVPRPADRRRGAGRAPAPRPFAPAAPESQVAGAT